MKIYAVLYAEDVPHYGTAEIEAENDAEAIAKAKAGTFETDDPDWNNTICKRIVHLEDPEGRLIAVDVPLDDYVLSRADDGLRLKIDAAGEMFDALAAQEMAEYDPEAARRKGYFDRARALRQAALKKARGQQ